nr:hypothetical protein [Tanacetum cinerariifolium]
MIKSRCIVFKLFTVMKLWDKCFNDFKKINEIYKIYHTNRYHAPPPPPQPPPQPPLPLPLSPTEHHHISTTDLPDLPSNRGSAAHCRVATTVRITYHHRTHLSRRCHCDRHNKSSPRRHPLHSAAATATLQPSSQWLSTTVTFTSSAPRDVVVLFVGCCCHRNHHHKVVFGQICCRHSRTMAVPARGGLSLVS